MNDEKQNTVGYKLVSVLMPTYMQEAFVSRALDSLAAQTWAAWELIIIDDASPGDVLKAIEHYRNDPRVHYYRLAENVGLGKALNIAMKYAKGDLIAYLPSDDLYYPDHLASLVEALATYGNTLLAYSGVRYNYNRSSTGQIAGYPIQLVQVMHRKTSANWLERETLVTDDLHRMYWSELQKQGEFVNTGQITCEWVHHHNQRHKLLREPEGGLNAYRSHFNVKHPLRFHSTIGNYIDEIEHYKIFQDRPETPMATDGLKILLVGELAYNPERMLAFEERGHRLYGLWLRHPHWYNTVGPLPFGHVQDIPYNKWLETVKALRPDIIYALLNWQAVPFAHEILMNNPGIPFIWHFKEGPFICLDRGTWPQLIDLYLYSDGQIYISPEMQKWFQLILPFCPDEECSLVLDGDLPKREWFVEHRSPRLSQQDGEIHTAVPGRPIGLHSYIVEALAREKIHLHFYGDYTHGQWKEWIDRTMLAAPGFLHLHPNVDQENWVAEFSQFDAGWLHFFQSENRGELRRAIWDDLNYPARISTLAAAGLPMLQYNNQDHLVATQTLVKNLDIGVFFSSIEELGANLRHTRDTDRIRQNVWQSRQLFTFDHHVDRLIEFFRTIQVKAKTKTASLGLQGR